MNEKLKAYFDMQKRHKQEMEDFPIAYAFNDTQLDEALKKLGATVQECCTVFNCGDIVKKADRLALITMLNRHADEIQNAMKDKELAEAVFRYEMDNHEYAINMTGDEDVLSSLCLDKQMLEDFDLTGAYSRARNAHMKYMEELGVI